jgi:hypothetical protein
MRALEIRRLFGGNCVLSGAYDPPVTIASLKELTAKLRECGVEEERIRQALLELKNSRHVSIALAT